MCARRVDLKNLSESLLKSEVICFRLTVFSIS